MGSTNICPPLSVLETLATSACTDLELAAHVDECDVCRGIVEEIQKDNQFLTDVRTALAVSDSASSQHAPRRAPETPSTPLEPELVRGYQIQEELHRGGQGVVYRAVQKGTRRTVAIKMLLGWRGATNRQKERFEREIRIAAGLRHPNIVTVFESGYISEERYGLVMEFIDGITLDRWSCSLGGGQGRDARRSVMRERLRVMGKVCDAVLCAHQRSIVHRDLKPANILVDAACEPHVLDFGIARDIGPEEHTRLTHTGEFAGTLAYASPEQISGDLSRVDTRSDIYSLGVILYELVSGRLPYSVDGAMAEVLRNIESAEPQPLPRHSRDPDTSGVDGEVTTIILKALAKDPARRYQTVAGLRDDIHHYLAGEPIEARRDSTWYVVRKTAGRHRAFLAGAVLVGLAIVIGAAVAGYGLSRARAARGYEAIERARSESEARAARSAGRIIQQMFVPVGATPDDAAIGRAARAARFRTVYNLRLGALADDPGAEASARSVLASEILKREGLPEAEVSLRMAIASLCKVHGERHPALAEAFHDLADILRQRGNRHVEAERFVRRAIESRRSIFRDGDSALAESQHLLARILLERGDAAGAADTCESAVAELRRAGKPDSLQLAAALATRSDIRRTLGLSVEAETDALEALILTLEAPFDDDDPFVIECLLRYAESLGVESLRPPDPTLVAALQIPTRAGVAEALSVAADGLSARDMTPVDCLAHAAGLETILSIRTSLFGTDHPSVSRTAAAIAVDRALAIDYPGLEVATRRLLSLLEGRLGRDHLAIVLAHALLFDCLISRENFEGAAAARRRMIQIWSDQPVLARDDLWMANEHRWLAYALALGGSFAEAEAEYQKCIDGLVRAGLSDHYLTDICTGGLGWTALHLGRSDQAESLARAALGRFEERSGMPPDQLALLRRHLAHVLIARDQLDEATPLIEAALAYFDIPGTGEIAALTCTLIDARELARKRGDMEAVERYSAHLDEARRRVGATVNP